MDKIEIKEIYVCVICYDARCICGQCYDDSDTTFFYAKTDKELIRIISKHLLSESKDTLEIYRVKAIIYNGEIYTKVIDYISKGDYMDEYQEKFIFCEKLDTSPFIDKAKKHKIYYLLKEKKKEEKLQEQERKKLEVKKKEREKRKKDYKRYLDLKKVFEG